MEETFPKERSSAHRESDLRNLEQAIEILLLIFTFLGAVKAMSYSLLFAWDRCGRPEAHSGPLELWLKRKIYKSGSLGALHLPVVALPCCCLPSPRRRSALTPHYAPNPVRHHRIARCFELHFSFCNAANRRRRKERNWMSLTDPKSSRRVMWVAFATAPRRYEAEGAQLCPA
jgi:hypothetical protein